MRFGIAYYFENQLVVSEKGKKKELKDRGSEQVGVQSINLIPLPSEEQVKKEISKEKKSLSGISFIALTIFVAVSVLGLNLWAKLRLNRVNQNVAEMKNEILQYQLNEVQKKTLDNKLDAYKAVVNEDFNANKVMEYLLEVAEGLTDVRTLYLDNSLRFEMTGTSSSYANVARLWHDISRDSDFFESISLDRVSKSLDTGKVSFSFSGNLLKDEVQSM